MSVSTGISIVASGPTSCSDLRLSPSVNGSACINDWPAYSTTCSLPRSDSSGSVGKLSKFKEDLNDPSPHPNSAKKRRSVLRILLPKLTRSKLRSTSSPLLNVRGQSSVAETYDGTGDAQDLLSVPQSASKPQGSQRTPSFSGGTSLRPASAFSTASLAVDSSLQSRQSLVNYERSLSVVGDNRRRKSILNPAKSHGDEVWDDEDNPGDLNRAGPLINLGRRGTQEALMENALQKHQLEKAALLRPGNQKLETGPSPLRAPVFTSSFGFSSTNEARSASAAIDDLDPLEAEGPSTVLRSQSMQNIRSAPGDTVGNSLFRRKKRSTIWTMNTTTTAGTRTHLNATAPPHSWSRYPSHTRDRRCSAAGRRDGVVCRDFAYDEDLNNTYQTVSSRAATSSSAGEPRLETARRRHWIVKSRSMTFGTILRYYSNLLTSSAARNRRSSTATGGRLEHPELEILPPMLPLHYTASQYLGADRDHTEELSHHLEEDRLDIFNDQSQKPAPCVEELPSGLVQVDRFQDRSQSTPGQREEPEELLRDKGTSPSAVDGVTESSFAEPDRALSARRLSRMYQAYVQLPASLDDTEVEKSGLTNDSLHTPKDCLAAGTSKPDVEMSEGRFLAIPSTEHRQSSGPITRHFPSVTVIDDRKGHWRSVSLLSAESGKSVRTSDGSIVDESND
ncbi:hypothetical protein E4T38_00714 [Aureobasidium subglaciale]|nr:hypothetical protein E4T38_00714 [Aureobasidium subglaciale]KAI5231130.1 hypothetical protein E4T40_00715 [Aureobasidium subglaciale]KAI5234255.1 hypothetical protein E4T41_00713 [Aureobasidium subglaciale]KAI5267621.1 hypothetical protein E4T46_00713 [Aureobasidium subglaciale]